MIKDIEYYLSLPYEVVIVPCPPDEGGWYAKIPILKGCMTYADTWDELEVMVEDAKRGWLETALEHGDPIPEPVVARSPLQ